MSHSSDPIRLFHTWQREARGLSVTKNSWAERLDAWRVVGLRRLVARLLREALPFADAAALATCDTDARPSVRMVLVKEVSAGGCVFHTDYQSRKGVELAANPYAALVFYWATVARQVRVEGPVERIARGHSEGYWAGRPRGSQLSASASQQSANLETRASLVERVRALDANYRGEPVPCPPRWGGYRLLPERMEFWQGQVNRLHERIVYERSADDPRAWTWHLLQP